MEGTQTYHCDLRKKSEPTCTNLNKDISYGSAISYYLTEIKLKTGDIFYEAVYQGESIFLKVNSISSVPKKYFFKISTIAGLNLRERVGIESRILVTLPYETVGEIIESDKTIYTLQNKKGYWIKVSYGKNIGWLFSGFVFISADKENFIQEDEDPEQGFFKFFKDLTLTSPNYSSRFLNSKTQKSKSVELGNQFDFRSEIEKGSPDCMDFTKLFYFNESNGFFHQLGNADENILEKVFGNVFLVKNHGCLQCCCYYGSLAIYFVVKDKITTHFLTDLTEKENFRCGTKIQNVKVSKD